MPTRRLLFRNLCRFQSRPKLIYSTKQEKLSILGHAHTPLPPTFRKTASSPQLSTPIPFTLSQRVFVPPHFWPVVNHVLFSWDAMGTLFSTRDKYRFACQGMVLDPFIWTVCSFNSRYHLDQSYRQSICNPPHFACFLIYISFLKILLNHL
jgi:hypothetical protein